MLVWWFVLMYIPLSVQTDKWRFGVGNAPLVLYGGCLRSALAPARGRKGDGFCPSSAWIASALNCEALRRLYGAGFAVRSSKGDSAACPREVGVIG